MAFSQQKFCLEGLADSVSYIFAVVILPQLTNLANQSDYNHDGNAINKV